MVIDLLCAVTCRLWWVQLLSLSCVSRVRLWIFLLFHLFGASFCLGHSIPPALYFFMWGSGS
jgi:hypothetical protein